MEMESRWYLNPGQTLETTKIEDRGHALHVTNKAWGKITAHLDRNRLIQEAIEKEQAHRQALKLGSEQMTKNWDNSVENIRIRKEEERQARLEKTKEDKMQAFLELRKGQEAIRQKYIKEAKKAMYISVGHPRNLTGALIQSEVMYQRAKQRDLEKSIQEHEREEEAKYAQKVKDGAEQEKLEKLQKEEEYNKRKLELRELYLTEMQLKESSEMALKEDRIAKERLDIINGEKEMERIKKFEFEEDRKRRAAAKQELKDFYTKQQKVKTQMELEDKEQDMVIEIYSQAKHRIQCLKQKKEREMQMALQARRDASSKKAVAQAQAKMDDEERILKKAIEERDRAERERLIADAAYQKKLIEEREADRRACIKREEERKFEEQEIQKWEMLNRFKQNEITKKYEQDKKERLWQETLQYRRELFEQMAQNAEEQRKMKEEIDTLYENSLAKLAEDDKQFFDYAEECMNYAKERGRPTSAIERVIREYKKENKLPMRIVKYCKDETKNIKNQKQLTDEKQNSPQNDIKNGRVKKNPPTCKPLIPLANLYRASKKTKRSRD